MIIFKNNMRRLLRDKYNLVVMVILPVILWHYIYAGSSSTSVRVGIIDNDGTYLTQNLSVVLKKLYSSILLKRKD